MFKMKRTIQRYHAALCRYEDQLLKKDRLLKESEDLLSYMRKRVSEAEERIDALARENKRQAENADVDEDLNAELFREYTAMLRKYKDYEELQDENYRLWVENTLLKAELLKFDPPKAAAIAGKSRR